MLKIDPILQETASDCGVACIKMILGYYGASLRNLDSLANAIDGVQVRTIEAYMRERGYPVASGNFNYNLLEYFNSVKVPVICLLRDHYVLVKHAKDYRIMYNCPLEGEVKCTARQFNKRWAAEVDGDVLFNWGIACMK